MKETGVAFFFFPLLFLFFKSHSCGSRGSGFTHNMASPYYNSGGLGGTPGGYNAQLGGHGTPLTGGGGGGGRFGPGGFGGGGMDGGPHGVGGPPQPYAPLLFSSPAVGGAGTVVGSPSQQGLHGTAGYYTGGGGGGGGLLNTPNTRQSFFGGVTPGASA